ncbi:hypothetical protein KP509_1Z299100 [Ceratopteris richardii]|nr:hypothetical protein KP509_1Z299100 [Ceratopteris richardii]
MEDASLQKKWHYMLQILLQHFSEGLLNRAQVIEWVLKQFQERETVEAMELLLPVVLNFIDEISTCQNLVRLLAETILQRLDELCPSKSLPSALEQPRLHYIATCLSELLCYLLIVTPDSFVALDCFPLPSYVVEGKGLSRSLVLDKHVESKVVTDDKADQVISASIYTKLNKHPNCQSSSGACISSLAVSIQRRAVSLAKGVNPASLRKNEGIVVQALDKALITGDIHGAYHSVFDDEFFGHDQQPEEWLTKITPWLKLSPCLSANVSISELYAVSFLCEWAICEFRDCRKMLSSSTRKATDFKAVCRVHLAVSLLCLRLKEVKNKSFEHRTNSDAEENRLRRNGHRKNKAESIAGSMSSSYFESPGLIHDAIVAWIDQHEMRRGERFERLQLLLLELIRKQLFWPPAYVRKLLVSGVLEKKETAADLERASRHKCLLQHLPSLDGFHMDDAGRSSEVPLKEALRIYRNERNFCLHNFDQHQSKMFMNQVTCLDDPEQAVASRNGYEASIEISESKPSREWSRISEKARKLQKKKMRLMDLKQAVAWCLHFPEWCTRELVEPVHEATLVSLNMKRLLQGQGNRAMGSELTPGCEDCGRTKKLKNNEGFPVFVPGLNYSQVDGDGTWWIKKTTKATVDDVKADAVPIIKPPKQSSRGRPKGVRKLSLSQLDAPRFEACQGAASTHVCDGKVNCPHHRSSGEVNAAAANKDRRQASSSQDLKSICGTLSRMRLIDRRTFATWLDGTVRYLIEGPTSLQQQQSRSQLNVHSSVPSERSSLQWHCGEEELAAIVCLLDKANDFIILIRLLLWLLPKASVSIVSSPGQSHKFSGALWNKDSTLQMGESFILASLRRYENIMLAANLLPEALSAGMQRAALLPSSGSASRVVHVSLFAYLHSLYKKYGSFQSFQEWEIQWKMANSQQLIIDFESFKSTDGETKLPLIGVNSSNMMEDREDCYPRPMGRFAKVVNYMKEVVRRGFLEVMSQMVNKERELSASARLKEPSISRWNEGLQVAQNIAASLLDCIKQQAGGAPNGDVQLAAAAVSAVVNHFANAVNFIFESFTTVNNSHMGLSSNVSTLLSTRCAHRILQAHVECLRLLKEGVGDKLHRVIESALTSEASGLVANVISHSSGRSPRPQFQLSPETPDPSSALGDVGSVPNGSAFGRLSMIAAAISAFILGMVLDEVVTLERVLALLRIREGIESMHHPKDRGLNPNGMSRVVPTGGNIKSDNMAEMGVFWLRILIGECKTVAGGLVSEILGESKMLAFFHRQRTLPLSTVVLPAYSLFLVAIKGQYPPCLYPNREETSYQQLACTAFNELLLHDPFREHCLKDTRALYQLLSHDNSDYEQASLLDSKGVDIMTKVSLMVPSRPRIFLHSLLDCKLPAGFSDEAFPHSRGNMKSQAGLVEELVQLLDEIHPATFHWQWLELRLLLNEQVFIEKLEAHSLSVAVEAIQAARSSIEEGQKLTESEKNFTEILLTRLLVRPDAAALYSEVLRLLGRAFEEYLILQVQWILGNSEMLLGRKFLRQQLVEMAQRKKLKLSSGKIKVWEWLPLQVDEHNLAAENGRKAEVISLEEGEVAEEDLDCTKLLNEGGQILTNSNQLAKKHFVVEKALADLVLPCLARSSLEIYSRFASQLIKQLGDLEQQVTMMSRGSGKAVVTAPEGQNKRFGHRKGPRSGSETGSPGIGRWTAPPTDSSPPSAAALQTSLWLRFRFLLLLLPPIYSDRERNMRAVLAPVLLKLLGTRFVQESTEDLSSILGDGVRDSVWNSDIAVSVASIAVGEDLFGSILSVLHALLSSTWAVWLKQKPSHKPFKPVREVPPLDKDVLNSMQVDLDHMQLPIMIRTRLQAAMPALAPSPSPAISAGPPHLHPSCLSLLHTCISGTNNSMNVGSLNATHKALGRLESNFGKTKLVGNPDPDTELDPWTLLEDTNTTSSSRCARSGVLVGSESGSNKACAWLRGAVRVQRTDLTYVGSTDDDS